MSRTYRNEAGEVITIKSGDDMTECDACHVWEHGQMFSIRTETKTMIRMAWFCRSCVDILISL